MTTSSGAFCGDYTTYSTSVLSTPRGGEGAGYIAENDINNKLTKHIDIRYHFTRQHIREKTIELFYVPSADNVADICTKALGPEVFIGLAKTRYYVLIPTSDFSESQARWAVMNWRLRVQITRWVQSHVYRKTQ